MKSRGPTLFFLIALIVLTIFINLILPAQDSLSVLNNPAPEVDSGELRRLPMSRFEFQLSLILLGFGLLIIILEVILIRSKQISSEDTVKFIIITLIITSTLFLITAGYSNDQIAPAIGLLGTIAGYLLGRIQNTNPASKRKDDEMPS